MPKRPSFKPIPTESGWMVSIPKNMSTSGKRERKYFADQKLADALAKKLRGDYGTGLRGGTLSLELALDAKQAAKILAPFGISLVEAARAIARKQEAAAGSAETFRERWLRYQSQQEGEWSDSYASQVFRMEYWLSKDFMAMPVALVEPEVIATELARYAESTRKRRAVIIKSILSMRGKKRRAVNIEILSDYRCKRLLAAVRHEPDAFRTVALLLLAGIRPDSEEGEITRMDWSMVGPKEIYLPHAVTKTGGDRHIPVTPVLAKLITGHPADGPIIPAGWKRRWTKLRALVGISGKRDITRHTFGSHILAALGEHEAKQAMGHTKDSDTLFRHYRRAVTTEQGKRYFGLE